MLTKDSFEQHSDWPVAGKSHGNLWKPLRVRPSAVLSTTVLIVIVAGAFFLRGIV